MASGIREVVGIVNHNNELLIGKKREDAEGPLAGKWHIPRGTLEEGEDDKSGLIRCFREEAGIEIEVGEYLAYHRTPRNTRVNWYCCTAKTQDIEARSDLSEVKWVQRHEAPYLCDVKDAIFWPKEIHAYFKNQDNYVLPWLF